MEELVNFDHLSIATQEVRHLNDSAYLLPKCKHPSLYQKLDVTMEDVTNSNFGEVCKYAYNYGIRKQGKIAKAYKASLKRAKRRFSRKVLAMKTKNIRAARTSYNNLEKRITRCRKREKKAKERERIEKKRKLKAQTKRLKESFSSFKI
mmetsp:Transcript_27541/g.41672  ORF Transcript_27541/g.41672 Transcript_27541/m.41672 type:complete len:149 (+) Transcript_27541:63-509(+)